MLKHPLLLAVMLFFCSISFTQDLEISGKITDTTANFQFSKAVVSLLRGKDSVLLNFTRSSATGSFALKAPKPGQYLLMISYPGYADHVDFIKLDKSTDLGSINMVTKAVLLQNVIVRGSAIRMKGDTLAFMADSFKVREGANVEDLLRRLPGLSVNSNGEITAQGQRVEKVLVDGDEFFGDDPTLATRNLQALAVKEVQVFDKKSDQAAFTGVDDGQSQKTINLKLKDEFKRGYFGKVKLGGGLPNRWENQAMVNAFKDKRKLSVYGIAANTNNNALGWNEERQFGGSMNSTMEVRDDGSIMMWSGGDEFGGTGGYYGEGLPTSWSLGTSYGNKWNQNRSSMNGAYRFQKLKTEANTSMTTQNILPDTQFFNNQKGQNIMDRWRHKAQGWTDIFIDSMQSITFTLNGSYGENNNYNHFLSEALNSKQLPVNRSDRTTTSDGTQHQFSGNALYKLKFKKKGRTLSASLGNTYSDNTSTGFLLTYNEFYNEAGLFKRDTIDQKKDNASKSNAASARLAYTEPIGKNGIAEISYGYTQSNSRQERFSYDKSQGKYEDLNMQFSNDFKFKNTVNRPGAGYRYNGKKTQFGLSGEVAFTNWQQDDLFRDTTRLYHFTNFFPRANFSYKLGQYSRIRFNYEGRTQSPSADQLQPVANNNNPLNILIGNPDLVQSFNHRFSMGYNLWKVLSNTGMWMDFWYSPTSNAFSSRNFTDNFGRQVSQTVNVQGNYQFGGYMGYNFKWKKPDIGFDLSLNPQLGRSTNFTNGQENRTSSRNISFGINLSKYKEKKFYVSVNLGGSNNYSKSTIRPDLPTKYWTARTGFDGSVDLKKDIVIRTDFSYNWRQKTEVFTNNNNAFIWNASIDKKILKKQDLRLGLRMNDILNQNIGFQRNISSNIITERTYDVIRRFWMATLQWNFNKGPQKAEEDSW